MEKIILTSLLPEEFEFIIRKVIKEELEKRASLVVDQVKDDELLKIGQVSEILKVSEVTVHKWKKLGLIPFQKLNRRLYFKKSDVLNSMRKCYTRK